MRNLFFLLCILLSTAAISQKPGKKFEEMQQQIAKQRADLDSSSKVTDSLILQYSKSNDSAAMARSMEQNTRNVVSYMNERERKQKQGMWMRLTFGGLLLVVGIFGIMRKRKKKNDQ